MEGYCVQAQQMAASFLKPHGVFAGPAWRFGDGHMPMLVSSAHSYQRGPSVAVQRRPFLRPAAAFAAISLHNAPAFRPSVASQSTSLQLAVPDLTGTWTKDKAKSDSMDEAIKLMQLGGLVRQAIKLVKGVKISMDEEHFTMAVFSVFPWFKVTEKYAMTGEPSTCKRRDLRRGKHQGVVSKEGGILSLQLSWDDPHGGAGSDAFTLSTPDELVVSSIINVEGQTCKYRTVYARKAGTGAEARAAIVGAPQQPAP